MEVCICVCKHNIAKTMPRVGLLTLHKVPEVLASSNWSTVKGSVSTLFVPTQQIPAGNVGVY